jgi:hypothetical protein
VQTLDALLRIEELLTNLNELVLDNTKTRLQD